MKILHIIDTLRSGGKERQLVELLKGLARTEKIECELIIMSEDVHYSYLEELDIRSHFLLRKTKKDPRIFLKLHRICKRIKPDIIHSWNSMCSVYAMPIVKLLGIIFVNGFLRDVPANFNWTHEEWVRAKLTFPFSDVIVANSKAGLERYNVPNEKAQFIHNGFDLSRVDDVEDAGNVRAKYDIRTDKVVGMVATFSENKDYCLFFDSAKRILGKRKDVSFVAVGDGKKLNSIKNTMSSYLNHRVKFLGKQQNIESIVNIFTIGVLTTNAKVIGEGISNSIMEYMALGKPVIATDFGGNRELVVDAETGFLVKPGDVEELTCRIMQLLDNPMLALQFGQRGLKRIYTDFSLEKMSRKYTTLYKNVMKGK